VTATASERGAGSDPVTRAVPAPKNAWAVATVTGDPPPKTSARPPEVTPAASCSWALSAPIWRAAPVAVPTAYTPLADAPAGVSPPSTINWPGGPGTTNLGGCLDALQVCFMQAMQYGCTRLLRVPGWRPYACAGRGKRTR
jgi:hypothetical protein